MGKFANSAAECGETGPLYIGPRPKDVFEGNPKGLHWHGKSKFDALGLPVPFFRRSAGVRHLKAMGFTDREKIDSIVGKMANHIERDDSHSCGWTTISDVLSQMCM